MIATFYNEGAPTACTTLYRYTLDGGTANTHLTWYYPVQTAAAPPVEPKYERARSRTGHPLMRARASATAADDPAWPRLKFAARPAPPRYRRQRVCSGATARKLIAW